MLALLGVLAVGSWQGRAGMTAAVSYARLPAAAAAMRCSKASKAATYKDKDKAIVLGQPPCQRGYRSGLHVKVLWYAVEYYCMHACMMNGQEEGMS